MILHPLGVGGLLSVSPVCDTPPKTVITGTFIGLFIVPGSDVGTQRILKRSFWPRRCWAYSTSFQRLDGTVARAKPGRFWETSMQREGSRSLGSCLAEFDPCLQWWVAPCQLTQCPLPFFSALHKHTFRQSSQPFVIVRTAVSILNIFRDYETGPLHVSQAGIKVMILLPQHPETWDFRCVLSIKIKRAIVNIESKKTSATTEISVKQQTVDMQIYVKKWVSQ